MKSNIDIPAADLIVVRFQYEDEEYLALLKMNYKPFYTHRTMTLEEGNSNEIIRHKSILPSESQRLTEAAIIRLDDLAVWAIEKKYEVNGEKTNYFSFLFLKCQPIFPISQNSPLSAGRSRACKRKHMMSRSDL